MARVAGLPERIDPLRLVEREVCLCGHLSLARMERLAASLCQRCLEAMEVTIATDLRLAFTNADTDAVGEAPPPDGYDAVPLVGDTISLVALVEDELMLALPMAPMHEDCPVGVWRRYLEDRAPSEAPLKPFAALSRIPRPAG